MITNPDGIEDPSETPEILPAIQNNNSINPQLYISNLPKEVKRRIRALKRLQVESNEIEAKFFLDLHQLECKYQIQFEPLFTKRAKIITADVEPTDEECVFPFDSSDPLSDEFVNLTVTDAPKVEEKEKIVDPAETSLRGVPDFWLMVMKNVDMLREMIQPHDEEILKHLTDIRAIVLDVIGFKLEFLFRPNDYFTNELLTKTYFFKFNPDMDNPSDAIAYDGPEITKCTGTTIDWKPNKNVTVRHIQKLQKHKGRGTKRVVMKTIQMDSFFNFFNPPQVSEGDEIDEDIEELLQSDYEIGQFLRERIVPRAVLYYTGEACEDEDDDDDDDQYDEYDEGDDEGGSDGNDDDAEDGDN